MSGVCRLQPIRIANILLDRSIIGHRMCACVVGRGDEGSVKVGEEAGRREVSRATLHGAYTLIGDLRR